FRNRTAARSGNTGGRDRMRRLCPPSRAFGHLERDLFANRAKSLDRAGSYAERPDLFFIGISNVTAQENFRGAWDIRDLMRQQPARARLGHSQRLALFA